MKLHKLIPYHINMFRNLTKIQSTLQHIKFDMKYTCIKDISKKIMKQEEEIIKDRLNDKICYDILNIIQGYFTKTIKYANITPTEQIES